MQFFGIYIDPKANYYLVTEFMNKGDLLTFLRESNELNENQSLKLNIALGIAKALGHLEKRGIVHRDVAARNVLLDEFLQAKLVHVMNSF
jgi:serine/threonine protein kinase